jgi:hypothetical protein
MEPRVYTIVVEGELGSRYQAPFNAMRLETRNGDTAIIGLIEDQADLQGVLDRVAALGLSLVSVTPETIG